MSNFEVKVYKLTIEEHPNADLLELAKVGDYRSIVRKGQFKTGDLAVYVPEAAIVPDWLITELGLEGKLAGKDKNRVKAVKLRKILSQGLVVPVVEYPFHTDIDKIGYDAKGMNLGVRKPDPESVNGGITMFAPEGTNVTEFLGVTKWEPPIPIHMQGEVFAAFGKTLKYDIENIKRYPNVFQEGEEVCITEKLHGTFCLIGSHPEVDTPIVTSKGLSGKGLAFKFNDANLNNLYVRAFEETKDEEGLTIVDRVCEALGILMQETPIYILGEIFGQGVQDLAYGLTRPQFRIFDIYVGYPEQGSYLSPQEMSFIANEAGIETVPVLYVGSYSKGVVDHYTDGKETTSGKESHMREGVVIKPNEERRDDDIGRVFLKSVSEIYLLRKGKATEYN